VQNFFFNFLTSISHFHSSNKERNGSLTSATTHVHCFATHLTDKTISMQTTVYFARFVWLTAALVWSLMIGQVLSQDLFMISRLLTFLKNTH